MTDRELLEAAAKAAGLRGFWVDAGMNLRTDAWPEIWNPLQDDGDALRLAVKLMLHVGINPGNQVFCVPTYSDKPTVFESCERNGVQDPCAATRRAIVRAAAAMAVKA